MVTRTVDLLHDNASSLHTHTVGQRDQSATYLSDDTQALTLTPIVDDTGDNKIHMTAIQS